MNTSTITTLPLKEDVKLLAAEVLGFDNREATRKEVGHEPSRSECLKHFIESGEIDRYRQFHMIQAESIAA
jgi:hypothetical protein